jgi:phytoene synthase
LAIAETLIASEQYCQEMTRREARNFYWGFIALPKRQRIAIYALYSFSRQVDDDVDLNGSQLDDSKRRAWVLERCAVQRERVEACYRNRPSDPVTRVLADVVQEFAIPKEELLDLIRGVEMDAEASRYETWEELSLYCHHVASAVGRMCTRIFGSSDEVALGQAEDLGRALQITNILRDVREDYDLGRVYLPREDLCRFAVEEARLGTAAPGDGWEDLVRFETARARRCFESGIRVIEHIPRRASACVLTMAGLYEEILQQIEDDPYLPLRQRAHLRKRTKLKVMLGSWLRAV